MRLVSLFFAAALLAGCQTLGGTEKRYLVEAAEKPVDYSRLEERRAEKLAGEESEDGRALRGEHERITLPGTDKIEDQRISQHLRVQIDKLLENWPQDPPEISLSLTDADSYAPKSRSTGEILIPAGLLKRVDSLDELNFSLAHELAHILRDHFQALEQREDTEQAITLTTKLVMAGDSLAHDDGSSEVSEKALGAATIGLLANKYFGHAWDRSQETEADGIGYELLRKAGFSGEGAFDTLDKLISQEKAQAEALKERCGFTPSVGRDIGEAVFGSMLDTVDQFSGEEEEQAAPARNNDPLCSGIHQALSSLTDTHPSAEDRREALEEHRDRHFGDRAIVIQQTYGEGGYLAEISPDGTVARTLQARNLLAALDAGEIDKAERLVSGLVTGPDDTLPIARYARYRYRKAIGNRDGAIADLEFSVEDGTAKRRAYIALAHEYAADARYDDAVAMLDLAAARYGAAAALYPDKLIYLTKGERLEEAWQLYQDCRGYDEAAIQSECEAAAEKTELASRYADWRLEQDPSDDGEGGKERTTGTEEVTGSLL